MKKFVTNTLLILLGFVLGILLMGYLSMRASSVFLEIVKLNYLTEQEILGARATKSKDYNQAVIHYNNVVSITSPPGLYSFSEDKEYWDFTFPFAALVLEKIKQGSPPQRVIDAEVGIKRGILANALELAGRQEEAEKELLTASSLLRHNDVKRTKAFISELISQKEMLLRNNNQYTYPTPENNQ